MSSKLVEQIEQELKSNDFVQGNTSIADYNTAWVALIRSKEDKNQPHFKQCIEFLRGRQHKDGSWGSPYPFLIFERIISTLAVILCFKHWEFPNDFHRIIDGQRFVQKSLIILPKPEEAQDEMTIAFELILPSLIDELKIKGLDFGSEDVVNEYRKERQRKLGSIRKWEAEGLDIYKVKPWFFSLEALDGIYSNQKIESIVADNGLICASYSSTAYALLKGINSPKSLEHISEIVAENKGGVNQIKCPYFVSSWSIANLLFSGFTIDNKMFCVHLDKLEKAWHDRSGKIGGSDYMPSDSDDISNSLLVLSEAKRVTNKESVNSLLNYLRGKYFITHEAENQPSLSANINALLALRNFQHFEDIRKLSEEVSSWTKNWIFERKFKFEDKWHLSQFYSMGRAIIAFEFFDLEFAEKIFNLVIELQNNDGGWGRNGQSSRLESSYAIISLTYWMRGHQKCINQKTICCLNKANEFMKEERVEVEYNFWIGKLLYSPIALDKITILCAEYALNNFVVLSKY